MTESIVALLEATDWYHCVLLFAVIFILVFHKSIRDLMARIKTIDKFGVKMETGAQQKTESLQNAKHLLNTVVSSKLLSRIEDNIKFELNDKNLETSGATISVLIRYLAASRIATEFEQIYNPIFGSQILLLRELNEVGDLGISEEHVRAYFDSMRSRFLHPINTWTMEKYLKLLLESELICARDDIYRITYVGIEYLEWMVNNKKPENKMF